MGAEGWYSWIGGVCYPVGSIGENRQGEWNGDCERVPAFRPQGLANLLTRPVKEKPWSITKCISFCPVAFRASQAAR